MRETTMLVTDKLKTDNGYVGRFAPSPTGQLHIGSLLSAVASFADARAQGGRWLVRMEDLDPPREVAGAASAILQTLDDFGLHWDGEVVYQSRRHALYRAALAELRARGLVYPCYCSRQTVRQQAPRLGVDGPVYSGHCAALPPDFAPENGKTPAWRLRVDDNEYGFADDIVGNDQQHLARDVGDFVLRRADGCWAYQLAVVVDDAEQGVNHIVRGQDLLVSTPRQLYLQHLLGYAAPHYAHVPLLTNALGQKWSKQTHAPALQSAEREPLLRLVLHCLGLPNAPSVDKPEDLLAWAVAHWRIEHVPKRAMVALADVNASSLCAKTIKTA